MEAAGRASSPALGRVPAQRRSRERLDHILSVASAIIAEGGSDQLRMSDVAARAGISIGSLYQYFPDKSAIIRSLAARYHAANRECIRRAFDRVSTRKELERAYAGLLDQYYALFLAEPVRRDIWSAMQADKQLMALELAESRACGTMLAAAMRRIDRADPKALAATAFLIWQLGEAAVRLAISVGRAEGHAIMESFKRMTLREVLHGASAAGGAAPSRKSARR